MGSNECRGKSGYLVREVTSIVRKDGLRDSNFFKQQPQEPNDFLCSFMLNCSHHAKFCEVINDVQNAGLSTFDTSHFPGLEMCVIHHPLTGEIEIHVNIEFMRTDDMAMDICMFVLWNGKHVRRKEQEWWNTGQTSEFTPLTIIALIGMEMFLTWWVRPDVVQIMQWFWTSCSKRERAGKYHLNFTMSYTLRQWWCAEKSWAWMRQSMSYTARHTGIWQYIQMYRPWECQSVVLAWIDREKNGGKETCP